jgi:hypothetical protein
MLTQMRLFETFIIIRKANLDSRVADKRATTFKEATTLVAFGGAVLTVFWTTKLLSESLGRATQVPSNGTVLSTGIVTEQGSQGPL